MLQYFEPLGDTIGGEVLLIRMLEATGEWLSRKSLGDVVFGDMSCCCCGERLETSSISISSSFSILIMVFAVIGEFEFSSISFGDSSSISTSSGSSFITLIVWTK